MASVFSCVCSSLFSKSSSKNRHCEALANVFAVLRKYKLTLNLEKCSFSVQARKFIGFMLIWRGIKANPREVQGNDQYVESRERQGGATTGWFQWILGCRLKVLQRAETCYQKIEKAVVALVIVKIEIPIKQVLSKPNLARKMVGWTVELSKFNISYEKKGHIKA
ncbi:hypothetical protein CR513_48509, partial [Mucuna pruriens]